MYYAVAFEAEDGREWTAIWIQPSTSIAVRRMWALGHRPELPTRARIYMVRSGLSSQAKGTGVASEAEAAAHEFAARRGLRGDVVTYRSATEGGEFEEWKRCKVGAMGPSAHALEEMS